jgi:hypothetical protein
MTYHKTKKEITETVLSEVPDVEENVWKEIRVDKLLFRWWITGRGGSGLRLTEEGMKAFQLAKIAHYEFPLGKFDRSEWDAFIKEVTKKLDCPYYLGVYREADRNGPFIRIYDHKIAMMLTLYGTLKEYLESRK